MKTYGSITYLSYLGALKQSSAPTGLPNDSGVLYVDSADDIARFVAVVGTVIGRLGIASGAPAAGGY